MKTVVCVISACVALAILYAAPTRAAAFVSPQGHTRIAVGPLAGTYGFDQQLSNYQWDTRPAFQFGAEATVLRSRFGAGLRLWQSHTTQSSGIPGDNQSPRVRLTSTEFVGKVRAMEVLGAEIWGSGHVGILHLGYDPDQVSFDPGGVGGPITVDYKPISEWALGAGVETRRELMGQMALSLQAGLSTFALDTAHRVGNEIVNSRERFYDWSLRLQASWIVHLD